MPVHHPAVTGLLRYFAYAHLPEHLQRVSRPFGELAEHLAATLPAGPETTVALRKLLESKDAAVRSALDLPRSEPAAAVDPVEATTGRA